MSAPDFSVCLVVDDDGQDVAAALAALAAQTAPLTEFEVIVVDGRRDRSDLSGSTDGRLGLTVLGAASDGHAARRNQAWRAASGESIGFLSAGGLADAGWVEATRRALARGRRLVTGRWMASDRSLAASGPASYRLWATANEAPLVTSAQLACRRADLELVGGFDETIADPDACDVELAARLVEAGVDPFWERGATVMVDVEPVGLAEMVARRSRLLAADALLVDRPKARARLRFGGVVGQRRNVEALLLVAGLGLARRDVRFLALAAPWVHERTCLSPTGGGHRRRTLTLPGVFAFDLYDALLPLIAHAERLRGRGATTR